MIDERLEYVLELDELGYGTYWSSEHHAVASHPVTIPNLFLAAAARVTRRVRLGVMCTVLPLHHPIRVAEEAALLDSSQSRSLQPRYRTRRRQARI